MSSSILTTKLFAPSLRNPVVRRTRLLERMDAGIEHGLTLVSAPAGFGKTTLVSDWAAGVARPVAWLSLDESDSSLPRFLSYLIAALRHVDVPIGEGVLAALQSPQAPPMEVVMTALVNELGQLPHPVTLVLDDYHQVYAEAVDKALGFLIDHAPTGFSIVLVTREDPSLPLARWRARGKMLELRAADLRFATDESDRFLNQAMGLNVSADDLAVLSERTEGWAAGLQLAGLSLRCEGDVAGRVRSFSGRHPFVLDYLLEEVLNHCSAELQHFLLHTSVLDRFCAPLCDVVLATDPGKSRAVLEELERANLFLIPLDNERYWYRYHHLFADLLRQRVQQRYADPSQQPVRELHRRASDWFEEQGWHLEAFQQAVAAEDIDLAARRVEGEVMPLHLRGEVLPVLKWLSALPAAEKHARPALWIMEASALLFVGHLAPIEPALRAAERALEQAESDDYHRNLAGHAHSIRAFLGVSRHQADEIRRHSVLALELLHPDNLPVRTAAHWTLGYAHQLSGDRPRAQRAYSEALTTSRAIGHGIIKLFSSLGMASLEVANNQLPAAADRLEALLREASDPPWPLYCEVHLKLAQIHYHWNRLDSAEAHAAKARLLAAQLEHLDRALACDIMLARLDGARGDLNGAVARLTQARQTALANDFHALLPELATELSRGLLLQNELQAAAEAIHGLSLPVAQARLALARGETALALRILNTTYQAVEAKGWSDEQLALRLQQALALHRDGRTELAAKRLNEAMVWAEPAGMVRLFVDEGAPMHGLLARTFAATPRPRFPDELMAAFDRTAPTASTPLFQPLIDPLSTRELAVLRLIADGHSNQIIGERLFLALSTVKGHNRRIFDKLGVQRRTEAIARARELGLLP